MQQRRVGVGEGDAAVPEREPAHVVPVLRSVARQGDVGGFDGAHLPRVLGVEQAQRDVGVEREQQRRAAEGLAGFAAHQEASPIAMP